MKDKDYNLIDDQNKLLNINNIKK